MAADIYVLAKALNFEPNVHQKRLFNAAMRAKYGQASPFIAVKSGQGTGKTAGSCVLALWLLLRRYAAMGVLSAPTMKQCTDVWLTEMRRILAKADPILRKIVEITNTQLYLFGEKGWGIKTCAATRPENFQGRHEEGMYIIFEEASGIPREIFETAKGTLTNEDKLFVAIGNPNTRDCSLFDCFNSLRNMWQCLTFNAEESPKTAWFDPDRNRLLAEEYGRDSDVYRVRVLGEFPHVDPNCVISSDDVEAAFDRSKFNAALRATSDKQIGMDLARFGGDENVIFARQGLAVVDKWWMSRVDPNLAVDRAFRMQGELNWRDDAAQFVVDAGGMGQGVMQRFYTGGKRLHEFHNNGTATKTQQYHNKITEAYFHLGKILKDRKASLMPDNTLIHQLSNRRYYTNPKNGKLVLESKDEYLKRFEDSPDRAEALALCFYPHAVGTGSVSFGDRPVVASPGERLWRR